MTSSLLPSPTFGVRPPVSLSFEQLLRTPVPPDLVDRLLQGMRAALEDFPHSSSRARSASDLNRPRSAMQSTQGPSSGLSDDEFATASQISMEQLVVDHADAVYRVALSVTSDPALAEDVSQDVLIKAWQSLPSYRGEAPLRHWILRITHNTAISALRRRREDVRAPADLPEMATNERSVDVQVQERLAIERFEAALADLDGVSRSIVVLREIEGMSYIEMSNALELPLPTIRTRLLRARRQLADALEGWQP